MTYRTRKILCWTQQQRQSREKEREEDKNKYEKLHYTFEQTEPKLNSNCIENEKEKRKKLRLASIMWHKMEIKITHHYYDYEYEVLWHFSCSTFSLLVKDMNPAIRNNSRIHDHRQTQLYNFPLIFFNFIFRCAFYRNFSVIFFRLIFLIELARGLSGNWWKLKGGWMGSGKVDWNRWFFVVFFILKRGEVGGLECKFWRF